MRTPQNWYYATLSLDGSDVKLAVDTASSDLWVTGAKDPMDDRPTLAPRSFQVHYGRGRVAGNVERSSFGIQGTKQDCDVGVANDEDPWWENQTSIDGLWGLSCEAGIADGLAAFGSAERLVTCMQQDKKLGRRLVALELGGDGGTLSLGGVPSELQSRLVYMPKMEKCDHWQVPLLSIGVRDRGGAGTDAAGTSSSTGSYVDVLNLVEEAVKEPGSYQEYSHSGEWALLDTGATGVVGPAEEVSVLAQRMGAAPAESHGSLQSYTIPCNKTETLPDMRLSIGDSVSPISVELAREDLLRGCSGAPPPGEAPGDACRCYLSLSGWETTSWVLGGAFLRSVGGIAFDFDSGAVGVAPAGSSAAPAASSGDASSGGDAPSAI